jgi:large subunit ribosomal protein L10
LSVSQDDETVAARIIKGLMKDIKTFAMLEGVVEGKMLSKAEITALADLPSKDQLRAQFMSVLNGPVSAFARVLKARAEKMGEAVSEAASAEAAPVAA